MPSHPSQPTLLQRAAAIWGSWLIRALFATLRVTVHDRSGFFANPPDGPVIFTFWHNRILAMTCALLRSYPSRRGGVLVLTSASRDGMWLGQLVKQFGMGFVRGSSSRRGATAMRELLDKVADGYDIAITPDGPRGPKYQMGGGPVYLAQKTGIPIVPVHASFGRALRLRTWDNFTIPYPFSRLEITYDLHQLVPNSGSEEDLERARKKIESVLRKRAD